MLFKTLSAAVYGIDANIIEVEVDVSGASLEKDNFTTVGLPDAAVRESRERIRAALKNCGYDIPPTRITINLAPADIKKEGSGFDLPMALGILGAYGALNKRDLEEFVMVGELSLDGGVRGVRGALPIAIMIQRYVSKISGPLLDRIDIHIDIPAVKYKELRGGSTPEGSDKIRERVLRAREVQLDRFARAGERIFANAQMGSRQIRLFCELGTDCERLLERAMTQQGLSARAHDRILKVSRTVADLDGAALIESKHIAEAIQYRTLDRSYWA